VVVEGFGQVVPSAARVEALHPCPRPCRAREHRGAPERSDCAALGQCDAVESAASDIEDDEIALRSSAYGALLPPSTAVSTISIGRKASVGRLRALPADLPQQDGGGRRMVRQAETYRSFGSRQAGACLARRQSLALMSPRRCFPGVHMVVDETAPGVARLGWISGSLGGRAALGALIVFARQIRRPSRPQCRTADRRVMHLVISLVGAGVGIIAAPLRASGSSVSRF